MILWEQDYLDLCYEVMQQGAWQNTRTGRAKALYGKGLWVYPGKDRFPLLTTRKMFWKPVFAELSAFMAGATLVKEFVDRGCNYWTPNARAWARNKGKEDSDLSVGKVYGFQWRDFNGVDQLAEVRRQLIFDHTSRRIVLSAWNPADLSEMCLPPCHLLAQFHVDSKELRCSVYMRSVDLALGLPSDIALYYALLIELAAEASLVPMGLHFHFGNAHVYEGHIDKLRVQTARKPSEPPLYLYVGPTGFFSVASISITPHDYKPQEAISYELYV